MAKKKNIGKKGPTWQVANIESDKKAAKQYLDQFDDPSERLREALNQVQVLSQTSNSRNQLRCFIYIISALVHHIRHGGLRDSQVQRLARTADALLRVRGVKSRTSKIAFLYGDLHTALSQIYLGRGQHLKAFQSQQLSAYISPGGLSGGTSNQRLSTALRALRLGNAQLAQQKLNEATDLKGDFKLRSLIEQIKLFRFRGEFELAEKTYEENRALIEASRFSVEAEWEKVCRTVTQTGEIPQMIQWLRRSGLDDFDYILEGFLWTRCSPERTWLTEYRGFKKLVPYSRVKKKSSQVLYKVCQHFETLYDQDIPAVFRLENVDRIIELIPQTQSIEQELLVWAAITRWLTRMNFEDFAQMCLFRYRTISQGLSLNQTNDVLQCMADVASTKLKAA